jgi:Cu/Ag efflux protein CusF
LTLDANLGINAAYDKLRFSYLILLYKVFKILGGVMKIFVQLLCVVALSVLYSSSTWAEGHSAKGVINMIKLTDRKLNISHGPISGLGMGAMTMDFKVYDPAMLDEVKKGHAVAFVLEEAKGGNLVIVEIEDLGMAKNSSGAKGDSSSHKH